MLKQKFIRGNLVHISKNLGASMFHFENDRDAIILGSYDDYYGGGDIHQYEVMFSDGQTIAWYDEWQLTLLDKGGEHLIIQVIENVIRKETKNILQNKNLCRLSDKDIITLLRFIGYDYSKSNNFFGIWDKLHPLFEEIKNSISPDILKEKYPDYDIEGVWNIFHKVDND